MALSIKNTETERLARMVARETGETITEAIQQSLQERMDRLRRRRREKQVSESIAEMLRRVDSLPTLDTRPEDEILGYDEHGLPRRW
jgi:antitoxin VapB